MFTANAPDLSLIVDTQGPLSSVRCSPGGPNNAGLSQIFPTASILWPLH